MFDFDKVVDRHGTWCTQWDYIADRFGRGDLQPFTISVKELVKNLTSETATLKVTPK